MAQSSSTVAIKNLRQWHSPDTRTEVIDELIHGVDRYNPTNLSWMEDYLQTEVKEGEYDLLANLAILKLYQFNPQLSNPEVIINILLKSLVATVQGPDFNLSFSLLREPTAILHDIDSDEQSLLLVMPFLHNLHELVRTCQFTEFWKEWNSETEAASTIRNSFVPQHAHLIESFRFLFATSITSCFSSIKLNRLSNWLDLSAEEVKGWAESVGWTVEGDSAVIPKNGDNDVKAGVVKENVELSQLTKLVATAAY